MSHNQSKYKAFQSNLSDYELLKSYRLPLIAESICLTKQEVLNAASKLGYPLVLKGFGSTLAHKTEKKLVQLNLQNKDAVRGAFAQIAKKGGTLLEGFSVQPFIHASREFVMGMFRDPQFGPVLMFGLGGIFTETLSDITFRLAPITPDEALSMINSINASSLLRAFRGMPAVKIEMLIDALVKLADLSMDHPDISEIDLNPALVTTNGAVVIVDYLIVRNNNTLQSAPTPNREPIDPYVLGTMFHPQSIAFVGASSQMFKWGHMLFALTVSGGFRGDIFLVNRKGGKIAGRTVYRTIEDIPADVDLAVVTIPAAGVIDSIASMAAKGIKYMLLITSGFSETGPNGIQLENDLIQKALQADILVLGPNTMGICNPHIQLYCTGSHVRPRAGSTAMVSQSGNMGTQLLAFAEQQGIGIRAFAGSGNEAMITIEDYLEAFEKDKRTRIIMLYIESIKNGRRFFEASRRISKQKPIILLKGGQSDAGSKAAASHTGALTSNRQVFNAVCRQAGIVQVNQPVDLLDLAAAFSSLPLPNGNRVAVMTLGGGWGVVTADLCEHYGLSLPTLSQTIIHKFDSSLPSFWSRSNPVDIVGEQDPTIPIKVIEALVKWNGCDAVINLGILGRRLLLQRLSESVREADTTITPEFLDSVRQALIAFDQQYIHHIVKLMERYQKPILGVSLLTDEQDKTVYRIGESSYKGIFYPTPERAVRALAKMVEYQQFIHSNRGQTQQ